MKVFRAVHAIASIRKQLADQRQLAGALKIAISKDTDFDELVSNNYEHWQKTLGNRRRLYPAL